jgi:hypothetical protein
MSLFPVNPNQRPPRVFNVAAIPTNAFEFDLIVMSQRRVLIVLRTGRRAQISEPVTYSHADFVIYLFNRVASGSQFEDDAVDEIRMSIDHDALIAAPRGRSSDLPGSRIGVKINLPIKFSALQIVVEQFIQSLKRR